MAAAREALVEMVAEADENADGALLRGRHADAGGAVSGLKGATAAASCSRSSAPRACRTSAPSRCSTPSLTYLPSPAERPFQALAGSETVSRTADESRPLRGVRLEDGGRPVRRPDHPVPGFQGGLKSDSTVTNVTRGCQERLGHLVVLQGKTPGARAGTEGGRPRRRRQVEGHAHQRHARRQGRRASRSRRSPSPSRCSPTRSSRRAAATRTRSAPRCTGSRKRTAPSATHAIRRPTSCSSPARGSSTSRSPSPS